MRRQRAKWHWWLGILLVSVVAMVATSVLAIQVPTPTLVINTKGLPDVSSHLIPPGTSVKAVAYQRPKAILLARQGDTWRAFSDRSTHRGFQVIWRDDYARFYDTVSSAMWDKAGTPVAGPAPRGLDWYPVTIDGGYVVVDLSQPQFGAKR